VGRFIGCLALCALCIACQTQTPPVVASPVPSPSPHTLPTAAILQSGDFPAGLNPCLGSGPIDVYLAALATEDPTVAARVSAQWQQLRAEGAQSGAVSVFAASQPACQAELGAMSSVKAATSFVAIFGDPGQADRAWQSGVFGFAPPPPAEIVPGVTRGTTTGLGLSSFVYSLPPVQLASWHRSLFVALVVVTNLDAATFKAATAAVDARLN
jgi:hypothetical protein